MYTPILKVKKAEIDAVNDLDDITRGLIKPLFEFIIPFNERISPRDAQQKFLRELPERLKSIQDAQGNKECLVDIRLIDKAIQSETLKQIMEHNNSLLFPIINTIPIFELNSPTDAHKTILNHYQGNLCIRITKLDIQEEKFFERIQQFIKKHNLKPLSIDIILDFGYVDETDELDEEIFKLIKKLIQLYPWNSTTFAAGAFPKDLSHLAPNQEHLISRYDYALWEKMREQLQGVHFADYTIQHPIQLQLGAYTPSSSSRYALEKDWLIQRGRKPKPGEGRTQYIAHAKLLVGGNEHYYGESHCKGDEYIMERSKEPLDPKKAHPGNPTKWLQTGICHHITLTANWVANHA